MARKPVDKSHSLQTLRKKGELERFIAEHERDEAGDMDKVDAAISRRSDQETASAVPKASPKK